MEYYQHLFTSSNPTFEMNQSLLLDFSKQEVDLAFKQTSPMKALGPDGRH